MKTSFPLVSVIVRSMDRPTLDRALASIAAQSYPNLEAVVVAACGASHRPMPAAVGRVPIHFVASAQPLLRPYAANAGLDAARGDFINLLDDDDDWLAHHAETLVRTLVASPGAGLAYAQSQLLDADERPYALFGSPFDPLELFQCPLFDPPAAMFRRSLVDAGVRFDTQFKSIEDVDFWVQCMLQAPFVRVPVVTCRVRPAIGTSGTSGTTGVANADHELMRIDGQAFEAKWADAERAISETPAGLLHRAKRLMHSGDIARARPLLELAYSKADNDVNILNLLGMARHYAGDSASGLPLIERALLFAPGHPGLVRNRELLTKDCQA